MNQNNNEIDEKVVSNVNSNGKEECNVPDLRFDKFNDSWKEGTVKDLFNLLSNNTLSRENLNYNGGIKKNIHYGDILTKFQVVKNINDSDVPFVNDNISVSSNLLKTNDIIIADTAEDYMVGKAIEIIDENNVYKTYSGLHTIVLRPNHKFATGYIAYYINSKAFRKRIYPLIQGIKVYSLSKSSLLPCIVKFPSMEEQLKISNLMQKIDSLINAQKKIISNYNSLIFSICYNYFNNKNTNFKLEDVCTIKKGKQINGKNFSNSYLYDVYNGGVVSSGKYLNYNAENCISISEGGNSCGYINFIEGKFWSGGHNYTLEPKSIVNDNFLYFQLKFKEKHIMGLRVGSGLPNIQKNALNNFMVYLPSLDEQLKFSNILLLIDKLIKNEKRILVLYQTQKDYLLSKMFI